MSNRQINDHAKRLIKAKSLIENPENWCQRAIEWEGRRCALGALLEVTQPIDVGDLCSYVDRAANEFDGRNIVQVNNELGHAATMQMFDRAIMLALEKQDA